MEGNMAKLFEEHSPDSDFLTQQLLQNRFGEQNDWDTTIPKRGVQELEEEEEKLKAYLDKLKKENFTLQTSLKAWQKTLEIKLEEFKKADLKLEETYNEIWSEREKFCSKLDRFNDEYGILSNWWKDQLEIVLEFENMEEKSENDQTWGEEIEKLEKEVAELKKEIEGLQAGKGVADVPSTPQGNSVSIGNDSTELPREDAKLLTFPETDTEIETCKGEGAYESELYSLVDIKKVKMAKRRRQSLALGRIPKLPKY